MADAAGWQFWMDTGGTFTDCLARDPTGTSHRAKVLSSGVLRLRIASAAGARRIAFPALASMPAADLTGFRLNVISSGRECGILGWDGATRTASVDRDLDVEAGDMVDVFTGEEAPVLAMRLLTGTAAGATLPPVALRLATTRGTNALLEGKGAQVAFFVTEGFADLLRIGDQRRPDLFAIHVAKPRPLHGPVVEVRGRLAADGTELVPLDVGRLRDDARRLRDAGCEVAAVALLHSYQNPAHERTVAAVLREAGFRFLSVSSELAPMIKLVPRAETTVVDAALSPVMDHYLAGVAAVVGAGEFRIMTSAGGLVPRRAYRPKDSLLSGPAGGVAGAAAVARGAGLDRVITFDMGGTSTDVARFDGGFEYHYHHAVAGARVMAPALRVESVAAGGGSICRFDGAALVVGPESAGARPGPACYGAGGPLTLTDVNLLRGRLDPGRFAVPVFPEAAEAALEAVLAHIREVRGAGQDRAAVLQGFLDIADERMAEAIRRISIREGYDPAEYALVAFGGAGGLHACAVAARLGIGRILYPADSGLLSARGLAEARPERIVERQILRPLETAVAGELPDLLDGLEREGRAQLLAEGVPADAAELRSDEVEVRFAGQDAGLTVPARPIDTVVDRFLAAYRARFGYVPRDRARELVAIRVAVAARMAPVEHERFEGVAMDPRPGRAASEPPITSLDGPALVQDGFSTLFIEAGWRAWRGTRGSLLLESSAGSPAQAHAHDPLAELELYTSRFRSIVEDMGELLRRCALSVNIRERLDYSCALLDGSGELVANAPHVPVHLGALGLCVRRVTEILPLRRGDIAVTNHPACGGAHLPDVTLIAPAFDDAGGLLGYVAARAHHAEIGGIRPGSMPADARNLADEGVVLPPTLLVRAGVADWESIRTRLDAAPYPSRRIEENLADLHAQLAAIRLGIASLETRARGDGSSRVRHYMARLKERSADALAVALSARPAIDAVAADALDDGTPIAVQVSHRDGRLRVDFSGSGGEHPGNLNATPAIVRSAVIYVLRLLAGRDLPLNEGLMRDVDLVLPPGLLAPRFTDEPARCPAVVGGNVETSQRIVDVLVRAFGLCASSQGTMNNVIFGNARLSYYETIGGGTGAGNGFAGCDAVHSHMTNTAITDPEILEARLPVRLERFAIRRGSGGDGRFRGGDGLERVIRFLEPVELSLLTQRRRRGPPGLSGGGDGRPGEQWIERRTGSRDLLEPIAGAAIEAGDCLVIRTPGGGGFGG